MSHVDEGALHAYLDGALEEYPDNEARRIRAHLERCATCAERLEAERAVRAKADRVLASADVSLPLPTLEDLRRLARTGVDREPVRPRALYRLGWAASIVLALGSGWMLRDGSLGERTADVTSRAGAAVERGEDLEGQASPPSSAERMAAAPGVERARARDEGDEAVDRAFRAPATVAAAGDQPAAETALADIDAPTETDRADTEDTNQATSSAESVVAQLDPEPRDAAAAQPDADVSALAAQADLIAARVPTADDTAGGAVAVSGAAATVADRTRAVAAASDAAANPERPTDQPAAEPAAQLPAEAPAAAAVPPSEDRLEVAAPSERRAVLDLRSSAGVPPTGVGGLGRPLAPTRDEQAEREREADPGSLVVPGLEVISIVWREEGVTPAGVRVLQRLEDGGLLELIHLPETVPPETVEPAAEGLTELVVPRTNGWLLMRAALSVEALGALLERLDASP